MVWKHSKEVITTTAVRSCDGRWWPGSIVWAWMRSPVTRCWSAFDCTRCLNPAVLYTVHCTQHCTVQLGVQYTGWPQAAAGVERLLLGYTQICLAQALKYDFGKRTWKLLSSVLEMSQRVIYFCKNDYEWKWKLLSGKDFYWIHKRHTFVIYDCFVRMPSKTLLY